MNQSRRLFNSDREAGIASSVSFVAAVGAAT